MQDRTALIISLVFHAVVLLFFTISLRAHFKMPKQAAEKYVQVEVPQEIQEEVPTPKPEPTQPKPEPTKKISDEIRDKLLDALKTPTPTRKPKPKRTPTPKPTRRPRPTNTPRQVATPTPAPPTPAYTRIPLSEIQKTPAAAAVKPVTETFSIQGDDTSYNFNSYGAILSRQLRRAWDQPRVIAPKRQEYITVVSFTVSRNGVISNIQMVESSGWPIMDETVLKALQKASPVEPLPFGYNANSIQVTAPFRRPL